MRAPYRIAISLLSFIALYSRPANAWQAVPAQEPAAATKPAAAPQVSSLPQQTTLTIDRTFELPGLGSFAGIDFSATSPEGTVVYLDNNDHRIRQSARAACANVTIPSSQIDPASRTEGTYLYYLTNQTGSPPVYLASVPAGSPATASISGQICLDLSAYTSPGAEYTEVWALILRSDCSKWMPPGAFTDLSKTQTNNHRQFRPCTSIPVALLLPRLLSEATPADRIAAPPDLTSARLKDSQKSLEELVRKWEAACDCDKLTRLVAPKAPPPCKDKTCQAQRLAQARAALQRTHQAVAAALGAPNPLSEIRQEIVYALDALGSALSQWVAADSVGYSPVVNAANALSKE
jgi:hypothetical protein